MRSLFIIIALLSIFGPCLADAIACNCEYCDEEKVIALGEETTTQADMYEEDSDKDGNRTICARSRDFNDRTFPSICYMLCYNHCTKYRMMPVQQNDLKKYVIVAYRPNYYKLKDGVC
nr:PREDICTED: uncharacterized protein LOC105668776 [Linepithema humile]